MYVWIGIDCDNQLDNIKEKVKEVEDSLGFDHTIFSLPFHISLKISFEVTKKMYKEIKKDLIKYFKSLSSFDIDVKGIEKHDNIIWIRMINNDIIDNIHKDINDLLCNKYNIELHEYDLDFIYHTTLFMDDDLNKIDIAYDKIKELEIPSKLYLNTYLIGISDGGNLGSFKIVKKIRRK